MELMILVTRRKAGPHDFYDQADAVVDSGTLEENPSWWDEQVKTVLEADEDGEIISHAFASVRIPDANLDAALMPAAVSGAIVNSVTAG